MDTRNCTHTIYGAFCPWICPCHPLDWKRIKVSVANCLGAWRERRRYRGYLATMDDRTLRDIAISRADAEREANLAFWRQPEIDERLRGRNPRTWREDGAP